MLEYIIFIRERMTVGRHSLLKTDPINKTHFVRTYPGMRERGDCRPAPHPRALLLYTLYSSVDSCTVERSRRLLS